MTETVHRMLPLYEGKMGHQYTHRFGSFYGIEDEEIEAFESRSLNDVVMPRYWVREQVVEDRLARRSWGTPHAMLGHRRVARSTDERTVISTLLPMGAASYGWILSSGPDSRGLLLLLAQYNSFVFDFLLRQFLSQPSIPQGTFVQVPVLPPAVFDETIFNATDVADWVIQRAVCCMSWSSELQAFSDSIEPTEEVDHEVDEWARVELDAAMFLLYGVARDDIDYIMDTFPIVKRKDEAQFGEYRTKRLILEIYDQLAEAERTGVPYQSPIEDLVVAVGETDA